MMVGALGNIPFYVTMDESALLSGLEWSSGARYSEHARHGETDMLEYVGNNPDQISFDIKLSAFLGINPSRMLESLRTLHKDHKAVKFALGTLPIPGYWVLTDMGVSLEHFHKDGTLLSADVSITLKEYVETVTLPIISSRISFTDRMVGDGRITPTTPTTSVQPSPTPSRSPVVPATTKPVTMSGTPVTKPVITAAAVAKAATYVKKIPLVAAAVGTKIVSTLSSVVNNLSIVQVLKKAFTTPTYPAVKAAPAKPVVVKPSASKNGYTR